VILGRLTIALAVSLAISGCAATTYDTSISTETAAPTTTVLPAGTAAELLPQLVTEASGLSKLILDGGDKLATVERLEALWAAAQPEVLGAAPDLASEISAEIAKSRKAAALNRPAAADKAYRNLNALVKAFLAAA
jgi:hypothetical protein